MTPTDQTICCPERDDPSPAKQYLGENIHHSLNLVYWMEWEKVYVLT